MCGVCCQGLKGVEMNDQKMLRGLDHYQHYSQDCLIYPWYSLPQDPVPLCSKIQLWCNIITQVGSMGP